MQDLHASLGRFRGGEGPAAERRTTGMETRHLRSFVKVAQLRSFSQAAEELYMAQSTISRHVASLERHVGVPLLDRSNHKVALTRQGQALITHACSALDEVTEGERAARGA
jgi:DNA-binding transcriptional LysR family regulator